jgi:hypothetical protein
MYLPESLAETATMIAVLETDLAESVSIPDLTIAMMNPPADGAVFGVACMLRDHLAEQDPPLAWHECEVAARHLVERQRDLRFRLLGLLTTGL